MSLVDEYLDWYATGNRSPLTIQQKRTDLRRLPAGDVAAITVGELVVALHDIPAGSREHTRAAWNGFFRWLAQRGLVTVNPVDQLPAWRAPAPRVYDIFTPRERALLLGRARRSLLGRFDAARMLLVLETGARKAEAIGMLVEHVDLHNGHVYLLGKGDKERLVPLPANVIDAVNVMLRTPVPALGRTLEPDDHVWFAHKRAGDTILHCTPHRPLSRTGWHEWWDRIARAALGDQYRKPHMARHSFATDVLDATEGDIHAVKELLGHATIRTTERYIHSSRQRLQGAALKLERFRQQPA